MKLSFKNVCSSGNLCHFHLEFNTANCTVIYEPQEKNSCSILALLAGVDDLSSGELLIDDTRWDVYFETREQLEVFSHVFDEGIMLANLSLRENLLLSFRTRFSDRSAEEFDAEVSKWMNKLGLTLDLNLRPVMIDAAQRKFLGLIRGIIVQPQLLLIDDPYYMLNKTQRHLMLSFLREVRQYQAMLIASADDDFAGDFADLVIDLSRMPELISEKPSKSLTKNGGLN